MLEMNSFSDSITEDPAPKIPIDVDRLGGLQASIAVFG
jgi:hypothetical protein